MTSEETITLTRREYDALINRNENRLAALDADDSVRILHEVGVSRNNGRPNPGCTQTRSRRSSPRPSRTDAAGGNGMGPPSSYVS